MNSKQWRHYTDKPAYPDRIQSDNHRNDNYLISHLLIHRNDQRIESDTYDLIIRFR